MSVCRHECRYVYVHVGIVGNVTDVVINGTNLGDELKETFNIPCQWRVLVTMVIKVTRKM